MEKEPSPLSMSHYPGIAGFLARVVSCPYPKMQKGRPGGAALRDIDDARKTYSSSDSAFLSAVGPESVPLAAGSRSTSSMMAIGAQSP